MKTSCDRENADRKGGIRCTRGSAVSQREKSATATLLALFLGWLVVGLGGLVAFHGCTTAGCSRSRSGREDPRGDASGAQIEMTVPEESSARCIADQRCSAPVRSYLVSLSDQLAIHAGHSTGAERVRGLFLAGELRLRSYRSYHATTDAREAIEHFKAVAKSADSPSACRASLHAALLQSEIDADPASAFLNVYSGSKRMRDTQCHLAYANLLHKLGAYRPDASKLVEIDHAAEKDQKSSRDGDEKGALDGPVVSPERNASLGASHIAKIDTYGARDAARIVVTLSAPAAFRIGKAPATESGSSARLYLDLVRTSRGDTPAVRIVGGLVERVRIGTHEGNARVVLDLTGTAYHRAFFLPEPFRVIIDLTSQPPARTAGESQRTREAPRVDRVVIDAGHGGSDPGAIGPSGLREKDVTLDIAHRVAPILARELGIMTLVTRDVDRYLSLEERTARANAFHADLFVSIHCNAAESQASRGVQSYVLDSSRDDIALRVAARENATSTAADAELGSVLQDLRVTELSVDSQRLASLIQKAAMASLTERYPDTPNGGIRSAAFYVLVGAQMPALLFEVSFISNPIEESRLATADYRQKLADGIVNGIRAYGQGR